MARLSHAVAWSLSVLSVAVAACGGGDGDASSGAAAAGTAGAAGGSGAAGKGAPAGAAGAAGKGTGGTTGGKGGNGGSAPAGSGGSAPAGAGGASAGSSGTAGGGGAAGGPVGPIVTPADPGAHDVLFVIDSTKPTHAISPYIYGTNQGDLKTEAKGLTLARSGGNRLTAYNWETNDSNAGSDFNYQNDDYISASTVPGAAMKEAVQQAHDAGASIIMTVPIAGWVAADANGPCPSKPSASQIAQRFVPILPKKGAPLVYPPDTKDGKVYADEFVSYLESQFPSAQTDPKKRVFYMLDNEPDLWSSTHSEIHPSPVTYAELIQKNTDFAAAIKSVAPGAVVFGSVNYGYAGYQNLQDAPDAGGKNWIDAYLDAMAKAETTAGKRLVDVLDLHWYPEAQGDGKRITDDGTSAGEVAARVQAPRSLWDATYVEKSWITDCCSNGAIQLIPWLRAKIAAHYPGTKLSFSEYFYGAGGSISGGVAQADVLGVFGREEVYAANMWELSKDNSYVFGGFALYRNYDGAGGTFGDVSVSATNSDVAIASVYASTSSSDGAKVVVVAINKSTSAKTAGFQLTHSALSAADVYTLSSAGPKPVKGAGLTAVAANAFSFSMPPLSASTIVFRP